MSENTSFEQIYDQAVRYLNIRMHAVGELQEKLQKKRHPRAVVLQVLRRLEELDFLNDERYASVFVENLKRYRNFGYFGIKAKLIQRRIPSDIVKKVLDEFFPPEEELEVARRFVKKLKDRQRDSFEKTARSLSSKGFRGDVISQVLREAFKE